MSGVDAADRGVVADLDGASNVLVLSSAVDSTARASYFDALLPSRPASIDLLAIDYRRTPDACLDEWNRHLGATPDRSTLVITDETPRSAAATVSPQYGSNTVVTVENPADLTGIGITMSEYLTEHGGADTLVSFDSLTALLQYVELQRAFRFLHVITSRIRTVDAFAHYHMDPDAHDRKPIATLASLFDAVAEFDDGEWSVQTR